MYNLKVPDFNSGMLHDWLFLLAYVLPAILAYIGYFVLTYNQIRRDIHVRNKANRPTERTYYRPTVTVGTILWRVVLPALPVVNVLVLVFVLGYDMVKKVFDTTINLLSIPLIKQ